MAGTKVIRKPQVIDGVTHWLCRWCGDYKPESAFLKLAPKLAAKSTCGIRSECRKCDTIRHRIWLRRRILAKGKP